MLRPPHISPLSSSSPASVVYKTPFFPFEVFSPADLRTSYRRELPLIQQMDGSGEIITDDMRLIEQFIRPIVSLFKNR